MPSLLGASRPGSEKRAGPTETEERAGALHGNQVSLRMIGSNSGKRCRVIDNERVRCVSEVAKRVCRPEAPRPVGEDSASRRGLDVVRERASPWSESVERVREARSAERERAATTALHRDHPGSEKQPPSEATRGDKMFTATRSTDTTKKNDALNMV